MPTCNLYCSGTMPPAIPTCDPDETGVSSDNNGGEIIWRSWVIHRTNTVLLDSATTSGTVWSVWTTTGSLSSSVTTNISNTLTGQMLRIWTYWCGDHQRTVNVVEGTGETRITEQIHYPKPLTAEERAALLAQQRRAKEEYDRRVREAAEQAAKRLEDRDKAEERAKKLLLSLLNAEQRKQFEEGNAFHVTAQDGTRYRIACGSRAGNITELDTDGSVVARYCIHSYDYPLHDDFVAQKLMLQFNLDEFKRIANRTPVARGQPQRIAPAYNGCVVGVDYAAEVPVRTPEGVDAAIQASRAALADSGFVETSQRRDDSRRRRGDHVNGQGELVFDGRTSTEHQSDIDRMMAEDEPAYDEILDALDEPNEVLQSVPPVAHPTPQLAPAS